MVRTHISKEGVALGAPDQVLAPSPLLLDETGAPDLDAILEGVLGPESPSLTPSASPPPSPARPVSSIHTGKVFVAICDFDEGKEGDLRLSVGDRVEIVGDVNELWFEGKRCGSSESGIFPKNFVLDEEVLAVMAVNVQAIEGDGGAADTEIAQVNSLDALWEIAAGGAESLAAADAVRFMQLSGLPTEVLGVIWELADTNEPRGSLQRDEFLVAMQLIAVGQNGDEPTLDRIPGVAGCIPRLAGIHDI